MTQEGRPRILIIDDDELLLVTTKAQLEAEGYEVATHQSAFGASSLIQETRPDLVLLDVEMPGLSGPGLAELVQGEACAQGVKIFFFSSNDDETLAASVREAGIDGFIRKGDRSDLCEQVARALSD